MVVAIAGPVTPYVTPEILTSAPTGITWKTIPRSGATPAQQEAEQMNICLRATSMIETACNNVLRATIDTETVYGPDYRVTIRPNGVTRVILARYPVLQVISGQWAPAASFPPAWQAIAGTKFAVERPIIGLYGSSAPSSTGDGGQAVYVAPGYITWLNGRRGCQIQITYVNGWPHTSLTSAAGTSSTVVSVDDCTGWAPVTPGGQGAAGILHDGNNQEAVTCTAATAQSGPGNLTLAAATVFAHGSGTVLSALPPQVMQAAILFATAEALVRGATATTIQSISGTGEATAAGHYELMQIATELVHPYRRII